MFLKGQIVYLETIQRNPTDRGGKIIEAVVTIVGRKYYTVKHGWHDLKFEKDTLRQVVECGGPNYNLFPSEQTVHDDRERFELYALFRGMAGKYECNLSLDQLRRIKAIIDENHIEREGEQE